MRLLRYIILITIIGIIIGSAIYISSKQSDSRKRRTVNSPYKLSSDNRSFYHYVSASISQRSYLPEKLAPTTRIEIRTHPKFGNKLLTVITDKNEIASIVGSTQVSDVAPDRTAAFGSIRIRFVMDSGQVVVLEYMKSDVPGSGFLRFANPWKVLAFPPEDFQRLIEKHLGKHRSQ